MSEIRRLTGFKPTGHLQLGNYLGAIRPIASARPGTESIAMIADLHALTVEHDPATLRSLTMEVASTLLACGVTAPIYLQSALSAHTELHYLLEATTGFGEAQRMIQFKEKSSGQQQVRLSLLTYPVLMAADILLHDTHEVPVGDDQSQHLELTRTIARRFNDRYGPTFTMPVGVTPTLAARLMDLQEPERKMGKSSSSPNGTLYLLDPPEVTRHKIRRAVTTPPGVANLREILAAVTGGPAPEFDGYANLKAAVAEAVIELLAPIRKAHDELAAEAVTDALSSGLSHASARAHATVSRAKNAIGLCL
ncbi:tryptophanyl-tRNA synthetase [Allocatelliglobosispora scoriae]|uniref:Tryptophan--tRNA ligase n=1 Tax=Allocatelliglobosispora scoriae TaxID=643052 RepID=A0A841BNE9_9ACTN|nr:tryptophan--tRNA ligase [Allocatelliglobosispora scoriae]MBB5869794.1 tryptophanyl-tRNA synthetase [Allocatelliglobosispora scoriae]